MESNINSLIINEKDSVAVALTELKQGTAARYKVKEDMQEIRLVQNVPIYHKFAVVEIKEGELVYKYGQVIGRATQDIKTGQHVHSHNLVSIREAIED